MKQIKVSEASGLILDYLVAEIEADAGTLHRTLVYGRGSVKSDGFYQECARGYRTFYVLRHTYLAGIRRCEDYPWDSKTNVFSPSTDWSQGGPIFDREIDNFERRVGYFYCHRFKKRQDRVDINFKTHPGDREAWATGPTLLVAGLRCWVMSQLGETAEVPEELV